ncbi:hypothetical protein NDU88_002901 [Pleurodeles waltl]|uniref:Uncharacterized protein n=1 Tax=Pleurodeles waltl TaxID=8319 RepID=A0AAV7P8D1_PLEWA|nr:hypothetical protein NDU88_002901 [Pleurodeles waltl]
MAAARLSTSRGGAERETAADDRNTAHAHRRSLRCDPRDYQHSQDSDANVTGNRLRVCHPFVHVTLQVDYTSQRNKKQGCGCTTVPVREATFCRLLQQCSLT